MHLKEKIFAAGIAVVFYFLVANIFGEFLIGLMIVGIIAMMLGAFFVKVNAINTGLMGGGILALMHLSYLTISQKSMENNVALVIAFIVLVGVAYFKFSKKPEELSLE
ncbi:MAG: hypothetical protein ABIE23_02825 [archaeon]